VKKAARSRCYEHQPRAFHNTTYIQVKVMASTILLRRKPAPASSRSATPRARLFWAQGIIDLARHAVASKLEGLDESALLNALQLASKLIDDVAAEMEAPTKHA
jgi:hypothetical protein